MKKIAINGFGRIGRLVFRKLIEQKDVEIVAINDLTNPDILAHLLKYDSAHGEFEGVIMVEDNNLIINGQNIKVFAEKDPINLPWKELEIDAVVESTGFFTTSTLSQKHIEAGAKKVIISAPGSSDLKTIVYGVNHTILEKEDKIISAASCTTNCLAPIVKVLNDNFKIIKGLITTIHAYTGDQRLQDAPHKDKRRARAAGVNIVPTSTGAAIAIGKVLPELNNKLDGIAMRVPIITGSVVDLVVELEKNTTIEEINRAFEINQDYASYVVNNDQIVSSDIIGSKYGSIIDTSLTSMLNVDNKKWFKIISWYDNELSYVSQYVRTFNYFINL